MWIQKEEKPIFFCRDLWICGSLVFSNKVLCSNFLHSLRSIVCASIFQTIHMAPKKRTHVESSSSQPAYDQNRFPSSGKANQFHEQFRSQSVESEREVAEELHDKLVFRSLATRNWFKLVFRSLATRNWFSLVTFHIK